MVVGPARRSGGILACVRVRARRGRLRTSEVPPGARSGRCTARSGHRPGVGRTGSFRFRCLPAEPGGAEVRRYGGAVAGQLTFTSTHA
ncbi:protein of unknown function [Streptomyces sp. KY75]|nr:protein of unknown function [Streptomyces sp. KY70]CAD5992881.1 protein of unknown function [Streptomyces sp. KY75]